MNARMEATVVVVAVLVAAAGCTKSEPSGGAAIEVTASEKNSSPSSVTVARGPPVAIELTCPTDETCAREAVFPALEIERERPRPAADEVDPAGAGRVQRRGSETFP